VQLAAIVGPTGVGKTRVAVEVAEKLDAYIISCDSMQVYRGMDIGTAKASSLVRQRIPHYLLDVVEPGVNYTVADYQRDAQQLIHQFNEWGKLPLLVGGTGLYYQAVVDDYNLVPMPSSQQVRQELEAEADKSLDSLYARLQRVDPAAARSIKPEDRKRIIRALEVYRLTGKPFSQFQTRNPHRYHLAAVGLYMERQALYRQIEARVDRMIEAGLVEEVERLYRQGYGLDNNSMQALGYKQMFNYLQGIKTLPEVVEDIKRETRRFAKRQMTWFRRDKRIHWFNVEQHRPEDLVERICIWISRSLEILIE
jgi:tRNA dimethylallyltransferase